MAKRRSKAIHLIPEPNWGKFKEAKTEEDKLAAFKTCDYFVHYEIADKAKHAAFHKWAAANWDKEDHKCLKKLNDHHFCTFGKVAYIASKLDYIPEWYSEKLEEFKVVWLALADTKEEEIKEEKTKVKKPSIQDHMREQVAPLCEQWDTALDELVDGTFSVTGFKPHEQIAAFGSVKGPQAKLIRDEYLLHFDEAKEIAKWKDAEIKEAYSNTTAKTRKALVTFYDKIITACDTVINTQKTTRKSRKPRKVGKDKVVARVKFCVNDGTLGIASINPADAIGQNEVWVYNIKNRKLGVYIAESVDPSKMSRSSISFKGTTMTGYNETKSVQRTLRRPNEQIKPFAGRARTKFNKAYQELKTLETKMNGRFNDSIIILRAF